LRSDWPGPPPNLSRRKWPHPTISLGWLSN